MKEKPVNINQLGFKALVFNPDSPPTERQQRILRDGIEKNGQNYPEKLEYVGLDIMASKAPRKEGFVMVEPVLRPGESIYRKLMETDQGCLLPKELFQTSIRVQNGSLRGETEVVRKMWKFVSRIQSLCFIDLANYIHDNGQLK